MSEESTSDNDGSQPPAADDEWVREEIVAGMSTGRMESGYHCDHCEHYVPIEAVDRNRCPRCETVGMIGTVIMDRQTVTALYPTGWFNGTNTDRAGGATDD